MNIQEISHYTINVTKTELDMWEDKLINNQAITPEIIGMLLGRAKSVLVDVKCAFCKEPIEKGKEFERDWRYDYPKFSGTAHKACYQQALEEDNKRRS